MIKIAHASDIQTRVFKRHKEFRAHFNNFYTSLRETQPDVIVLTGDIIHDKTHVSPELFDMEVDFFKSLLEIAPVHVVPGNHDCFTPGHQVLTKAGWINIEDYINNNHAHEVATFNETTKEIEFQYPVAIIKNPYNGNVYNFTGKDIDMSVTENHNILYSYSSDKKFRKKKAKDISNGSLIPINGIIKNFKNNFLANLLGFTFAEATFVLRNEKTKACRIQFHLKSKREINYISNILENLNYEFNIRKQKDETVYVCIYGELAKNIYSFFNGKKQIPWRIFENDLNFLKSFLIGYLNGDGSKRKDKNNFWTYTSISKQSVEIINTIGRLVGSSSHCSEDGKEYGNYENSQLQFVGNLNINNEINNSSIKNIDILSYEGFVYCLSVDNGNLLIRNNNKIFITGNCNLNNLSRLDSLTPIFKAINDPNLFYYKKSGVYRYGTVPNKKVSNIYNFVVFSCFDDESLWPTEKDLNSSDINIGLFHGMVQGAQLQNGQIVEEHPYKLKNFLKLVDYLLLGDIHKMQILDKDYRAAYAGSLIQQNYAESIEKGYLLWKIESKKKHSVDFVKLPNLCPFYTLKLSDDLAVPLSLDYQKNARIRIISRSLTSVEKSKIEEDIGFAYAPAEIAFAEEDIVAPKQVIIDESADLKVENLEDVAVQEKLFRDFFASYNLKEETLKKVLELNKIFDAASKTEEDIRRNIQFKIGKMPFHNMFSYGEENCFDFSKHKGILGIFGKNGSGKSSLVVDVPLYILSNKISKKGVVKNDLIINDKKDNCGGSLEIYLGNDKYIISRSTSVFVKSGKNKGEPVYQGKTEVDFRCIKSDGTEEDKNGLQRDDTDRAIRKVFGTPDDFMATSIAPQWELLGLIGSGGTKRQELIGRYFDIDIFEQKNKLAKEEMKTLKAQLKLLESRNLDTLIQNLKENLLKLEDNILEGKKKFVAIKEKITELSKKIQIQEKKASQVFDKRTLLEHIKGEIQGELLALDKKIKDMKEYPCIKNPDCCLLKDLAVTENKKKEKEKKLEDYIQELVENTKKVEEFAKIQQESEEEKQIKLLERQANEIHRDILYNIERQGGHKTQIEQYEKEKFDYLQIQEQYQIYDYFLLATSKDGISKNIIARNLGIVNAQIKKILSVGVNFDVELVSMDDGKSIEIFFKHERNKPRRIELCSGMEKTIIAIALRAALVSVTTLPRSNIFVLDEVFSSLDPEYVDAVTRMLEYLKELFDSVIIITHLDSFKDICDHSIEVARDDEGFSRIVN